MKKKLFKGLIITGLLLVAVLTISFASVEAKSVYDNIDTSQYALTVDEEHSYTLEEMLNYALQDEYLAQAEYQAIIDAFGEVKPFTNILPAEQTHIDMLLPLFEAYGIEIPENNAADSVVIPETITSAIATGIEAEQANIAMYEAFLAQDNLPDDVRDVFTYLMNASQNHLTAFSHDRMSYYGEDMMNQFKHQFKNTFQNEQGNADQTQNQYKYQGANGQSQSHAYKGSQGNQNSQNGNCPN